MVMRSSPCGMHGGKRRFVLIAAASGGLAEGANEPHEDKGPRHRCDRRAGKQPTAMQEREVLKHPDAGRRPEDAPQKIFKHSPPPRVTSATSKVVHRATRLPAFGRRGPAG
jgi:hypothetical protein